LRVADYIAQRVVEAGADCCFLLTGGMAMHLNDAFGRVPGMRYYCNHHEQASAFAADAYARQTGKLGLAMATSGPGATNLLTGIVGAYQDSVPVLFLTGQCKRVETIRGRGIKGLRQCGFLEVDIVPIVESVTKYAAFVENPERVRYHLDKAIHLAMSGRPGPVLLDIPLDIQAAPFDDVAAERFIAEDVHAPLCEPGQVRAIFDRLAAAKRPLILAGHGIRVANQVQAFRGLAHRLQVPVVTSLMAKDLMLYDDSLFVGHPGPRGGRGANFAVQSADLILILGCSLHIQTVGYEGDLFAPGAHKIQIEIDAAVQERERAGVQEKYGWDIGDYLPKLLDAAQSYAGETSRKWLDACRLWKEKFSILKEPHDLGGAADPVNLYEFVDVLSDVLRGDETILTDAGQPHPILGQAFRAKVGQRYLNPGSLAEMGYALPASFGAAAADPTRTVIAVTGDGSLQTNLQELQTLVHYGFNVKLFVINNGGYGSIRRTQETFFQGFFMGSTPESGVTMPDSEAICKAYGLRYLRCDNRSQLRAVLERAIEQPGPVFCEIMAQYNQRILPGVPSYLLPDGSMKSRALHEMGPDIGVTFDEVVKAAGLG
jgi:acetolactate synthase-1/2/3 large subunit